MEWVRKLMPMDSASAFPNLGTQNGMQKKDFADYLVEDHEIRTYLKKRLYSAGVSKIEIERASDRVKIAIYTAKPGVVIGKGGSEIEKVKAN